MSKAILSSVSTVALYMFTNAALAANITVSGGAIQTEVGTSFSPTGTAASGSAVYVTGTGSTLNGSDLILTNPANLNSALVYGAADTIINLTNATISSAGTAAVIRTFEGSNFTLDGGSVVGTGAGQALLSAAAGASVTVKNATFTSAGSGVSLGGASIYENTSITANNIAMTISTAGTANLSKVQLSSASSYGLSVSSGSVTADDFLIKGASNGVNMSAGTLNLTNGTIETSATNAAYAALYAVIAGAKVTGDNLTITSTSGAMGIRAGGTSDISLTNSTINVYAAHGLRLTSTAASDLKFSMQGGAINTTGNGSIGVAYATMGAGSQVTLDGVVIKASGAQSHGIYGYGVGTIDVKNGSILIDGSYANMAYVTGGASLSLDNMTMRSTDWNGGFLYLTSSSQGAGVDATQTVTINNSRYQPDAGTGIAAFSAHGGTHNVALTDSDINAGAGMLVRAYTGGLNGTPTDAVLNLSADNTRLTGMSFLDDAATVGFKLTNGSHWEITTAQNYQTSPVANPLASRLTSLELTDSSITFTAPVDASDFKTLTLGTYHGQNATITLNTHLGTDSSATDKLIIDGGSATGSTTLLVMNTDGQGVQTTGNGILLVETTNGATTDATAFQLGNRVAAGAYEYRLFQGGNAGADGAANDQNWYLRNSLIPVATPPDVPVEPIPLVRSEVIVATTITPLAMEYGYAMLDSLHERVGEAYITPVAPVTEERVLKCKDAAQNFKCVVRVPVAATGRGMSNETRWARSGWARLIGNRGFHDSKNFIHRGADYDYAFGAIQAGLDLYAHEQQDGTLDKAGIYVGYGQITSNVKGQFGGKAGSVDMDAYTVGGYWSHFSPNNWYTDAVVQGAWYTNTSSKSVHGMKISPDGFGILASLEGGYAFKFNNGWALEPQAQVVYQNVSFDNARDGFGTYRFNDGESLRGRLGLRLTKTWNQADGNTQARLVTTWLRANIWHEFLGKTRTDVTTLSGLGGASFNSYLAGTWGEIGAGVNAQMTDKINIFATGAYNRSLDNKGREGWDGRLGMTVKW